MVCFAFFSVLHLSRLLFSAGQPNFLGFTLPLPSAGPAGWRAGASGSAALTFHKCHLILSRPVPAVAGGLLGGVGPPGAAPRGSPRPRAQRGACVPAGIDKENVELSPTAGHANSGRMRHGSASQVQKQRSAGSFKRHSIKKIV